ncbi:MAG TPA: GNAT family protein [Candidatus Acidoferrales bacterium]|nr:GNAT family protein [Candidatus Acidoferrales bacterium]
MSACLDEPHAEPASVTLEGVVVRLEPLDLARHLGGLVAIGLDPSLWRFTTAKVRTRGDLERYLARAIEERERSVSLPFANVHRASGRVAGCTRFGNIERMHRRVEIGWTWVGAEFQRTAVNTEAKYLMFRHAFEDWGYRRVELKTSSLNEPSKAAMRRLGLVEEGTFRKHMLNEDGGSRDTVYFSVIDDEWPAMKARLERMLARDASSAGREAGTP